MARAYASLSLSVLRVFAPVAAVVRIDDVMLCHWLAPLVNAAEIEVPDVAKPFPVAPVAVLVPAVEVAEVFELDWALAVIGKINDTSKPTPTHKVSFFRYLKENWIITATAKK